MSIAEINTPNGIDLYCASLNVANSISCATIHFSSVQYDAAAYSTFVISAATVNTIAGAFGSFSSFAYSTATLGTITGVSSMAISSGTADYHRTTVIDASVCRLSTVTASKAVVQDFAAKVARFSVITASIIAISVPTVSISTFTNTYASNAYMDNAAVSSLGASVAGLSVAGIGVLTADSASLTNVATSSCNISVAVFGALTATSAFLANATTSTCIVSVAGIGALDASLVSAGSVTAADVLLGGGSVSSSLSNLQAQISTLSSSSQAVLCQAFQHVEPYGTNGGQANGYVGTYSTLTLNLQQPFATLVPGMTLSTSIINVPVGMYAVESVTPVNGVGRARTRLYELAGPSVLLYGHNAMTNTGGYGSDASQLNGVINISTAVPVCLQLQVETASVLGDGTNALGVACSFNGADQETYTTLKFTKFA